MSPVDHIKDPKLRQLFSDIEHSPWKVVHHGPSLLHGDHRDLNVLLAIRKAALILTAQCEADQANPVISSMQAAALTPPCTRRAEWRGFPDESAPTQNHLDKNSISLLVAELTEVTQFLTENGASRGLYDEWYRRAFTQRSASSNDRDEEAQSALCSLAALIGDAHAFARELRRLGSHLETRPALIDHALAHTNSALLLHARAEQWQEAHIVLDAALALEALFPEPCKAREELAANAIALCLKSKRDFPLDAIMTSLVPERFNLPRLAFNIACFHAYRGDKAAVLSATRLALELGEPYEHFQSDPDFAAYACDMDFRALIDASCASSHDIVA